MACKVCRGDKRAHVGVALSCPGGYGTVYVPEDFIVVAGHTEPEETCVVCQELDKGIVYSADVGKFLYRLKPDDQVFLRDEVSELMEAYAEHATKSLGSEQLSEARKAARLEMIAKLKTWIGRVGHEDYYKAQAKLLEFEERVIAAEEAITEAAKLEREACIAIVENSYNSKVAVAQIRERGEGR